MAQYLLLNTRCYFPYFFPRLQCFCNVYFCSRFFKGYYSLFASSSCELALAGQDECRFNVVVRVRILPDKKKKSATKQPFEPFSVSKRESACVTQACSTLRHLCAVSWREIFYKPISSYVVYCWCCRCETQSQICK